jgi:hypothetical protein
MKSTRPENAKIVGQCHWLKDTKLLKTELESADKKARQGNLNACFLWLVYYNWGYAPSKQASSKVLELACKGIPNDFSKICSPEITVNFGLTFQLLCSLADNNVALKRLANGMDSKVYQAAGDGLELQPILFQVANLVRTTPFRSLAKIEELAAKGKVKISPGVTDALKAIKEDNETATFNSLMAAMDDHAKRFKLKLSKGELSRQDIIARCPSILWNLAVQRGMTPPVIPSVVQPFLLTRSTLGLD